MKRASSFLILSIVAILAMVSLSASAQDSTYSYAYISIEGKVFSKKLNVTVDLGVTPEQLKAGKDISELLSGKKSYAAVLNFMVEKHFELVETLGLEMNTSFQGNGSGGTYGIVFIMKKKKTNTIDR
jgi:hypothetical protein